MVKVKATRNINFGIVNDSMLVFEKDQLIDFPTGDEYKDILEKALTDGFLIKFEEKKPFFSKVLPTKKIVVASKKEVKED